VKQSLHERIRSDFEARILSGDMAPGDRLPIERDLEKYYGCSRMTVNKALSALATAGLIDRRKRGGTFVARPRVHSMVLDVPDLTAIVRDRGQNYRFVVIARKVRKANMRIASEAELAGKGDLLQLDGLHLANDTPLALEYRLISVKAVPEIAEAEFGDISPGTWLLQNIPWTEAETRISAVSASENEAKLLAVVQGTACLCVERTTWRKSEEITHVKQIFLGDAYDLVARFGPSEPARG
tara:strand:+ start:21906 stop:22625 length:720 start_codon:yes stop_codon:yes gene_type:complete